MTENLETKKTRNATLNIGDRCEILHRLGNGEAPSKLAAEYNVSRQAISKIKKREQFILKAENVLKSCDGDVTKKRYRATEENPLEQQLFEWMNEQRRAGILISGPMIKKQALLLNKHLGGRDTFTASDGWLDRFKKRHAFKVSPPVNNKPPAESADVSEGDELLPDLDGTIEDLNTIIESQKQVTEINLDHVYSCDEKVLYWKLMPDEMLLGINNKSVASRKKPKNRLTILFCTNASGTHKLPLLIIGKIAQPRCFNNIKNLPVFYVNQENVWMTSDIMRSWYSSVFLPEIKKKHNLDSNKDIKITLIMDNADCHPSAEELNNLCDSCRVQILPSNVTPLLEPLDQSIIEKFKRCYRKMLLEKILAEDLYHSGDNFLKTFNLLDCCNLCDFAWGKVMPVDIRNCWRNVSSLEDEIFSSSEIEQTRNLIELPLVSKDSFELFDTSVFNYLFSKIPKFSGLSIDQVNNWLNVDSDEIGWQPRSIKDIILGHYPDNDAKDAVEELNDQVSYDDQDSTSTDSILDNNCPTFVEAFNGFNAFIRWYQNNYDNSNSNLQLLQEIHQDLIGKKLT
ncbi:jerky protein homolog-like [Microplitis mediator]|uniref:jerky protein homolog-like n=1 Tax=Microplitis mediator TaxID=375433 RepID=UPI002552D54D|nr:jerky protein homolog-like [Microplitis mediator]